MPDWQLHRRLALLLGRDLAFAVRGYGDCAPTARTNALTERLTDEIQRCVSRWRGNTQLMIASLYNLVRAFGSGGRYGSLPAATHAGLLAALKDGDRQVRSAAAQALGLAGVGDPKVVEALLAALKDSDKYVRSAAAQALASQEVKEAGLLWRVLRRLCRQLYAVSDEAVSDEIDYAAIAAFVGLAGGRQLPGYRWRSLKERNDDGVTSCVSSRSAPAPAC